MVEVNHLSKPLSIVSHYGVTQIWKTFRNCKYINTFYSTHLACSVQINRINAILVCAFNYFSKTMQFTEIFTIMVEKKHMKYIEQGSITISPEQLKATTQKTNRVRTKQLTIRALDTQCTCGGLAPWTATATHAFPWEEDRLVNLWARTQPVNLRQSRTASQMWDSPNSQHECCSHRCRMSLMLLSNNVQGSQALRSAAVCPSSTTLWTPLLPCMLHWSASRTFDQGFLHCLFLTKQMNSVVKISIHVKSKQFREFISTISHLYTQGTADSNNSRLHFVFLYNSVISI